MRSLQIHPPLSPPHALITVHQPPSKTRRRRNVMTTRADPPVAAPCILPAPPAPPRAPPRAAKHPFTRNHYRSA